jgi:hypothetical protein
VLVLGALPVGLVLFAEASRDLREAWQIVLLALLIALAVVIGAPSLRAQQAARSAAAAAAAADSLAASFAAERWQVKLADGSYRWELRLVRASANGDTLVVRQAGVSRPDSMVVLPVDSIDELQLVQKSEQRMGRGARGALGSLTGADDTIYLLWKLEPADRRRVILQIVREHPTEAATTSRRG